MVTKEFHNDVISFQIKDGILFGEYLVEKVDLDAATKATLFRKDVANGRAFPAFADLSKVKDVSREARTYFSQEAGEDVKAIALLINNPVTRMMANFFVKFNMPSYPLKFFTNKREAVQWLVQFTEDEATKHGGENFR